VIKARQGVEYLGNAEVRVVDDEGNEVAQDGATIGEIIIRGNAVMKGYYNDPAATAKAIRNGWFYSGDAAVVHPDGYIEIRDRWKDVIISGGENISSVEIEGVLLRHPAVQEVRRRRSAARKMGRNAAGLHRPQTRLHETSARGSCVFSAANTSPTSKCRTASVHRGTAQDRHRQDSEVCAARRSGEYHAAVSRWSVEYGEAYSPP
jgi:hypothetical protein